MVLSLTRTYSPPARDVRPTVGFIPTKLLISLGDTIEPSVSEPKAAAHSPMAVPIPLPELDPEGSPRGTYGLLDCPPLPENPDGTFPRKLAHSLRFAFPNRIAPAARNFAATWASRGTTEPRRAKDPMKLLLRQQQCSIFDRRAQTCSSIHS